ncbi:MAG: LLM class flavin-dependent oxidoreductase, partial [Myxococcota bacterium]
PIFMGAEGPKNVALAAEIADGWLPLYYSPFRQDVYAESLGELKPGFEIAQFVACNIDDDLERALMPVKAMLSFYIGGMGAKKHNFHTDLMARMGFEAEAHKIQDLFMAGKRAEAVAAVPEQFADEISLCGPRERVIERIQAWEETPVTSLLVASQDIGTLRQMAEIVL